MKAEQVQEKYTGETASEYEHRRSGSKKWNNEQNAVELFLHKVADGQKVGAVLDLPVGTGRFIPLYKDLNLDTTGVDVSEDMISEAQKTADDTNYQISLQKGNILDLSTIDANPDVIINIRLLNWFSLSEVATVLEHCYELEPKYVIAGVRTQPDDEISTKKRIWLAPAQIISQVLKYSTENDSINIHPEKQIIKEMNKYYHIENRILVDIGTSPSQYGSEYYIYLLRRK